MLFKVQSGRHNLRRFVLQVMWSDLQDVLYDEWKEHERLMGGRY